MKIAPCKHCGYAHPYVATRNGKWSVLCLGLKGADICGGKTRWRKTRDMALTEWNQPRVMQSGNSRGSIGT